MKNPSDKSEPLTLVERIARAAGILAYLIESEGPIHQYKPMFEQFMREYRSALVFEDDLALALSWHKNGYREESSCLAAKQKGDRRLSE